MYIQLPIHLYIYIYVQRDALSCVAALGYTTGPRMHAHAISALMELGVGVFWLTALLIVFFACFCR